MPKPPYTPKKTPRSVSSVPRNIPKGTAGGQGRRGWVVNSSEFGQPVRRDLGESGKVTVIPVSSYTKSTKKRSKKR